MHVIYRETLMNMYHFLELVRNVEPKNFAPSNSHAWKSNEQARDEAENRQSFRVI